MFKEISYKTIDRSMSGQTNGRPDEYYEWTDRYYEWTDEYYEWRNEYYQ